MIVDFGQLNIGDRFKFTYLNGLVRECIKIDFVEAPDAGLYGNSIELDTGLLLYFGAFEKVDSVNRLTRFVSPSSPWISVQETTPDNERLVLVRCKSQLTDEPNLVTTARYSGHFYGPSLNKNWVVVYWTDIPEFIEE